MTMTDLPGVDQPIEQAQQLLDVGEVQPAGRLVEDVDAAGRGHVGGQLEPLPFAAGQCGERLAEAEVAEPDVGEPVEDGVRGRRACLAGAEEVGSASVTGIARTSLMSRPASLYSRTLGWNLLPSHSSQGVSTVSMNPSSV